MVKGTSDNDGVPEEKLGGGWREPETGIVEDPGVRKMIDKRL